MAEEYPTEESRAEESRGKAGEYNWALTEKSAA
jgi:hypothetical protein